VTLLAAPSRGPVRVSGLVRVSATSRRQLRLAADEVAQRARCALVPTYGDQERAFSATLPLAPPPDPLAGRLSVDSLAAATAVAHLPRRWHPDLSPANPTRAAPAPQGTVLVLGVEPGAGASSVAVLLGATVAATTSSRAVAVAADASLGRRIRRCAVPASGGSVSDRSYAGRSPDQLEVLDAVPDGDEWEELNLNALLLVDVPATTVTSWTGAAPPLPPMAFVLVARAAGSLGQAEQVFAWLADHGHAAAVQRSVVVLSPRPEDKRAPVDPVGDRLAARCAGLVTVPHDPHLAASAELELTPLRPATRHAYMKAADLLVGALAPTVPS
jgi:MinD-like ATPase involved in chromosome partitioning or flagellar assembly